MRDLYKVLGIAPTADNGRIKTAFRRRAKAFHPDLNPGNSRAEERFKELTEAYEVLKSEHARATYDAYRAERRSTIRRRVAGSAALMAASFVLTLGTSFAALAVYNAGVPVREGWQLPQFVERAVDGVATAFGYPTNEWTRGTSVALANAPETDIAKTTAAGPAPAGMAGSERQPGSLTAAVDRAKADGADRAKAQKRVVAASRPPRPPSEAERREAALQSMVAVGDEGRTWPETEDAPRMSLGAGKR